MLLQALKAEAYCQSWNDLILTEAGTVVRDLPGQMATVLWMWWADDWKLGQFAAEHLPASQEAENALVEACPETLRPDLAKSVITLAKAHSWGVLHAAGCAASFPPEEAFAAQLKVSPLARAVAGLSLLVQRFPPAASIETALKTADAHLIELAGKRAAREPALLEKLEMQQAAAQQLLWSALQADPGVWQKLRNRQSMLHVLLDSIAAGKSVSEALVLHLSSLLEANLVDYPQRAALWTRLPTKAAEGFLRATAAGWIARFQAEPDAGPAPEGHLEAEVFSTSQQDALLGVGGPSEITAALYAFERFSQLDEKALDSWLARLMRSSSELTSAQAKQLGSTVRKRGWSGAAQTIRAMWSSRRDLAPALRACLGFFGPFERFYLQWVLPGPTAPDPNQFWDVLDNELVACYPEGPMDRKLWTRANGDESMLDRHGNGRQQWHSAIHLLRNGGGGRYLTVQKLLSEARWDYWKNAQFKTLEDYARKLNL